MQITQTHKIIISAVVIVLLLGIYIIFDRKSKQETENTIADVTQSTTTPTTTDSGTGITGGYKIEQVPIESGKGVPKPIPDLNREPVLSSGAIISPEAKTLAVGKI